MYNFISTFDQLDKLYEEDMQKQNAKTLNEACTEELTEGKIKDSLKKVATRLGADAATVIRSFAELIPGDNAIYDMATHIENKAVLKALQSGNEKVLNSLTVEDIEELKQDIEEYEREKATKKTEESLEEPEESENPENAPEAEAQNAPEATLEEAADSEEDSEVEEPRQVICECDKCGALVIKSEADIAIDEGSDLVNIEDECQFCDEANGYRIVGVVAPYEAPAVEAPEEPVGEEELEELLDFSVPVNVTANGNDVTVGGIS